MTKPEKPQPFDEAPARQRVLLKFDEIRRKAGQCHCTLGVNVAVNHNIVCWKVRGVMICFFVWPFHLLCQFCFVFCSVKEIVSANTCRCRHSTDTCVCLQVSRCCTRSCRTAPPSRRRTSVREASRRAAPISTASSASSRCCSTTRRCRALPAGKNREGQIVELVLVKRTAISHQGFPDQPQRLSCPVVKPQCACLQTNWTRVCCAFCLHFQRADCSVARKYQAAGNTLFLPHRCSHH